jgi:SAM-dependent methyltransferase
MDLSERILLAFSKKIGITNQLLQEEWNIDNALTIMCEVFPDFLNTIVGKRILDFGCGEGYQSIAMVRKGAKYVVGIDVSQERLTKARYISDSLKLQDRIDFTNKLEDKFKKSFDIVISQNSMEHFKEPYKMFLEMKSALKSPGKLMITFGPPWYSPYGSHMQFFTVLPYVNIFFSEKTVMQVRTRYRNDGALKYAEVEGGLNRMTVRNFDQLISNLHAPIVFRKYDSVMNLNFINLIPLARELFVNRISCIILI